LPDRVDEARHRRWLRGSRDDEHGGAIAEGLRIALETAKDFQKLFPAGFSIGPTYPLEQINEAIARSQTKQDLRVFVTP
jgi:hypothetical protein